MKVLYIAAEASPFVKTGGLADVLGSLPQSLIADVGEHNLGIDCRVVIPKHSKIAQKYVEQMEFITSVDIFTNGEYKYCGIFQLVHDNVTFYFIDNEYYFNQPEIYQDTKWDIEKYGFFSKAALSILPVIDFRPDIIHAHDWHAAPSIVLLNAYFQDNPFYNNIKTVFTIHNLKYQGIYDIPTISSILGLDYSYFADDKLGFYRAGNILKGGIVYADYVTTVSPSYAEEIQTPGFGERLDGLLRARSNNLMGIINGISYNDFNPKTDKNIYEQYGATNFVTKKRINKTKLQEELGLEIDEKKFLIGCVSRLTSQKGIDLIEYAMPRILWRDDIQVVVLGSGDEHYENILRYYQGCYPGKVIGWIGYSNAVAQKIYAATDLFLMPSLFEPCGLSQLIALAYGSVPLVRETGGLKDTIIPYNEYTEDGYGFSFKNYNADELVSMIEYAYTIYKDSPKAWQKIVRSAMKQDFSWTQSADKYKELYKMLVE